VQAQSIENTEMMRVGWGAVSSRRRETMRRLAVDAEARRTHLLRAAMFTSLEDAARIV
jgi:3-(3-hydroxy-phenyl)propionate hydroxylase